MTLKKLHETRVVKDAYNNWQALDTYEMPDGRVLEVLTMKRFGGNLKTTATVKKTEGKFLTYRFSDFSITMADVKMRCTRDGVEKQHTQYAADPDRVREVMARALAHYAPKES